LDHIVYLNLITVCEVLGSVIVAYHLIIACYDSDYSCMYLLRFYSFVHGICV